MSAVINDLAVVIDKPRWYSRTNTARVKAYLTTNLPQGTRIQLKLTLQTGEDSFEIWTKTVPLTVYNGVGSVLATFSVPKGRAYWIQPQIVSPGTSNHKRARFVV